ncbi:MAG: DUF190 domain-containing protein [Bacillota bacterium]|nr:DUF190 domain-containing protein [Bacillota bacterium]
MALGKCKLLKVYLNENTTYKGHNVYQTLVMKFKEAGIAGVTVSRGIEGYGQSRELHTWRILELSSCMPIIIEAIDTEENIKKAIEIAKPVVNDGLMMVTDVEVIRNGKETK